MAGSGASNSTLYSGHVACLSNGLRRGHDIMRGRICDRCSDLPPRIPRTAKNVTGTRQCELESMNRQIFRRILMPGLILQSVMIGGGYATGREIVEFFLVLGPTGGLLAMGAVSYTHLTLPTKA